jgi:hypothetical protein
MKQEKVNKVKKNFLDKYGVGGTERLTAEIIFGINDLPNEAAPFRVDEAAIESGIPSCRYGSILRRVRR